MLDQYVGTGYSYITDLIDKLNFDELKLSDEVVNMVKDSVSNALNQISNWTVNFLTSLISGASSIATIRNIYGCNNTCNIFYMCR